MSRRSAEKRMKNDSVYDVSMTVKSTTHEVAIATATSTTASTQAQQHRLMALRALHRGEQVHHEGIARDRAPVQTASRVTTDTVQLQWISDVAMGLAKKLHIAISRESSCQAIFSVGRTVGRVVPICCSKAIMISLPLPYRRCTVYCL